MQKQILSILVGGLITSIGAVVYQVSNQPIAQSESTKEAGGKVQLMSDRNLCLFKGIADGMIYNCEGLSTTYRVATAEEIEVLNKADKRQRAKEQK